MDLLSRIKNHESREIIILNEQNYLTNGRRMFVTHSHNLKGKRKTIYLTEKKIENEQQSRVFNQKKNNNPASRKE